MQEQPLSNNSNDKEAKEDTKNATNQRQEDQYLEHNNAEDENIQEHIEMEQVLVDSTPEESTIEEALDGADLILVAEEWKKNGLVAIPEDQIQKIEGIYLLKEELKQNTSPTPPGNNIFNGILGNMVAVKYNPKGPRR